MGIKSNRRKLSTQKNNVPIKLTQEQWVHIPHRHPEMEKYFDEVLSTVEDPEVVLEGDAGCLMAVKYFEKTILSSKYLVVIYKEVDSLDGFVLTAYFTNQYAEWRNVLWKQ